MHFETLIIIKLYNAFYIYITRLTFVPIIPFTFKHNRCMEEYCQLCSLESYNVRDEGESKVPVDVAPV